MPGARKPEKEEQFQTGMEKLPPPDKNTVRARMRRLRRELDVSWKAEMDRCLCRNLLELGAVREAEAVYLFASFRDEPDTFRIFGELTAQNVRVAFPRVSGNDMEFYWTEGPEQLVAGYRGIPEPDTACLRANAPAAPVIMPGLAFTPDGRRIGYGGGYYDRFLAREPEHERIALAYPFQILKELPVGEQDVPVRQIVTINGVILCNKYIWEEIGNGTDRNWETGQKGGSISE